MTRSAGRSRLRWACALLFLLVACAAKQQVKERPAITSTGTRTRVSEAPDRAPPPRKIDGVTVPPVKVAIRPLRGRVLPERASDVMRWRASSIPLLAPVSPIDQNPGGGDARDLAIDDRLANTSRLLASLRAAHTGTKMRPPPKAVMQAWRTLLSAVDDYLDQPPARTPAVQLVRTKVGVETELDADGGVWALPPELRSRVRARLAYLEHRLDRARTQMKALPRGREVEPLIWPIDPVIVNSEFGTRVHPISGRRRMHYGLDLDGYEGQVVISAGAGVVMWAGWMGGHGKHIEVLHPGGWITRYSHLSHIMVREGERLDAGDSIGFVGSTGHSTGPHLHFEVWRSGEALDPSLALGAPPFTFDAPGTGYGG